MRIIINMHSDGCFDVVTDGPCDVFTVCNHAPNDRVYKLTECHTVSRTAVDDALRDAVVGHSKDERHEAIAHRILCAESGTPRLKPVK